jgi:hypothetical protein
MHETKITEYTPSIAETEHIAPDSWDEVSRYVTSLTNEPDFISYVESRQLDKRSIEHASVLADYADAVIDQQGELLDEKTATQIRLVANATYITHVSHRIDELRDHRGASKRLSNEEWNELNQLKEQAVWYNQLLSNYMYNYSDESFSAITQATVDQVLEHMPRNDAATRTMQAISGGARTEAATRHLLDDSHVPYRPATQEEDLKGADFILQHPKGEFPVDIKRSLDQLAQYNNGYDFEEHKKLYAIDQHHKNKRILLFPGFTDNQLGDNLRLNAEQTSAISILIGTQMMRAGNEIVA